MFTKNDIYLFREGTHYRLYSKLGSHTTVENGIEGTRFAVWCPNASSVSVIGDFNDWNPRADILGARWDDSGIWEGFIEGALKGARYKYHIVSECNSFVADKGDPFAYYWEPPPANASIVWDMEYDWGDGKWMRERFQYNSLDSPLSIYEVHTGSWKRVPEDGNRCLTYREIAPLLAEYVKMSGFTHVEFMPIAEHPFYGSWGYQTTGYFAPTNRYGTPQDFMYLVDHLHRQGVGVILDWVPSHFPNDEFGLVQFDGTHLFEHADPRRGFHPDWKSCIFNYGRNEVRAFLVSSALFWLDLYHVDGLRVDAVASMLYLDYSRKDGEWVPNRYGGRENLEAIDFLRGLNGAVYSSYPDVHMIAEESTAWPMVSRSAASGGLGFGMKWNMGWMHDVLEYFQHNPVHRKYHHDQLTFGISYTYTENFLLPLSHDEVVYGKGSLIGKMPGDSWQKSANLRLLFGYMYAHPGKKLIFMGGEFGQCREWNHEESLDWDLLELPAHHGIYRWITDLNHFYLREPSLYELDFSVEGFEWIDCSDRDAGIVSFVRNDRRGNGQILVVCNFTPVPHDGYRIGMNHGRKWKVELSSDWPEYGGSGYGDKIIFQLESIPAHGRSRSLSMTLPPLGILFLKSRR